MIWKTIRKKTRIQRHFLLANLARVLVFTLSHLPDGAIFAFLRQLSRFVIYPLISAKADSNLKIAFPEKTKAERKKIIRGISYNFGTMAAEILIAKKRGTEYVQQLIHTDESRRNLDECLQRGKGVILLTGHFGNWELLAWWINCNLPLPLAVLNRRVHNPRLNLMLNKFRAKAGLELIDRDKPPRLMVRHLKKPALLGMLPDQDVDVLPGEFLPFFGRPAHTITGPAALAILADAAILPTFLVRKAGQLHIQFRPPILPDPNRPKAEEKTRLTLAWSREVEKIIKDHPDHWAWWHNRWNSTPEIIEQKRKRHLQRIKETQKQKAKED